MSFEGIVAWTKTLWPVLAVLYAKVVLLVPVIPTERNRRLDLEIQEKNLAADIQREQAKERQTAEAIPRLDIKTEKGPGETGLTPMK